MKPNAYTAAQLSRALGVTPRAIRDRLDGVSPVGEPVLVRGMAAAAWDFMALPGALQQDLMAAWHQAEAVTSAKPWRSIDHFITDPPPPSSGRTDLKLETCRLKLTVRPAWQPGDFSQLQAQLALLTEARTPGELAAFWDCAFRTLADAVAQGRPEAKFKRAIFRWVQEQAPFLSVGKSQFYNLLQQWRSQGQNPAAVLDRRATANQKRAIVRSFPAADRDRLLSCAVRCHGGDIAPAWAELTQRSAEQGGFSPAARQFGPECPRALRALARGKAEALYAMVHQPRKAMNNSAYMDRDWSQVQAGDWFSSDDFTLEVYFYIPDGDAGWKLTRGQFLPMVDERSLCILDFILIPERSYTGVNIRTLMNRVGLRFGLPNKGYHYECGIWKNSQLVGGAVPWGEVETKLTDRLGIKTEHSLPGNAKAKPVEFIGKLLQRRLRRYPGWVGSNEQVFKVEQWQRARLDVEAGRKTPWEAGFLSMQEWFGILETECNQYNRAPQRSRIMGGGDRVVTMAPEQAWRELQPRNPDGSPVPLVNLKGSGLEYLLTSHCKELPVTRSGIRFTHDGKRYAYSGEVTGQRVGERVKLWFDVEMPETAFLEDMRGERFPVEMQRLMPAHGAAKEDFENRGRTAIAHNRAMKALVSALPHDFMPAARTVIATPDDLALHRQMTARREEREVAEKHRRDDLRRGTRAATELGLSQPASPRTARMAETIAEIFQP